jgi:Anaphase-promoting complex subunit 11 RING-H2 finger
MSAFPKYFTVEDGASYKLYLNTVYKSNEMITQTNVVWPIDNIRVNRLTVRLLDSNLERSSIRKWNGSTPALCNWTLTGSSVEVFLVDNSIYVNAPVVHMSEADKEKLPYNSCSFKPSSKITIEDYDDTAYVAAKVYRTDPANTTNTRPLPPTVTPTTRKSLPSHITTIVLADAIRKNECCPITSEPITEKNATVTCCGHVFCSDAIDQWLSSPASKGLCPMCKQVC